MLFNIYCANQKNRFFVQLVHVMQLLSNLFDIYSFE